MRGKGAEGGTNLRNVRITPAYAGKRLPLMLMRAVSWDHPRLCGEKRKNPHRTWTVSGSPPPMRGKVKPLGNDEWHTGITPAYAGKSTAQYTAKCAD